MTDDLSVWAAANLDNVDGNFETIIERHKINAAIVLLSHPLTAWQWKRSIADHSTLILAAALAPSFVYGVMAGWSDDLNDLFRGSFFTVLGLGRLRHVAGK